MSDPLRTVGVDLGDRGYDVIIGAGALADLGPRTGGLVPGRGAFVVVDANLPPTDVAGATDSLRSAGFTVSQGVLDPTEATKSIDTAQRLLGDVARARLDRGDVIVGLGGGIVGDVAGFVAATYRRGTAVVQCPTTLLAMVDASVGGKTGVNLPLDGRLLKNMVGVFWQPRLVLADVATLASLPAREVRCGLAECVKHALLADGTLGEPLFDWTNAVAVDVAAGVLDRASELVARNVHVKAAVVGADEREQGTGRVNRALLNLGHTYAHVLEGLADLSPDGDPANVPLKHGEAVALGLVAATAMSVELGRATADDLARVRAAVSAIGLPRSVGGLPPTDRLIDAMSDDKKVVGGRLRVVAPVGIGTAELVDNPPESVVSAGWSAIGGG